MRRLRRAGLIVVTLAVVGCSSSNGILTNEFAGCTFEPHTNCAGLDLAGVIVAESDLRGANFAGANLEGADLRRADLRDANLKGADLTHADLTRADLRGADMSDAILTSVRFEHADWVGSNRSGARLCKTVLPDGGVSACKVLDVHVQVDQTPASIVKFAAAPPVVCIDDFVGDGIMVDWRIAHAQSAVFLVDDIQASSAQGTKGRQRIPFLCDGAPHTVTIQALGEVSPVASRTFTVSLDAPTPR
jgi:Pentapeptide repeats (8 copies)